MRHNKFDRSYGSRKANFVKVFVDDLPKELDALTHLDGIQSADLALESAKLAKAMVLNEVSIALLAQANAGEALVLKLISDAA